MSDAIELKDFRTLILNVGNYKSEYQEVSRAILENLNAGGGSGLDKPTQQNILNSGMKDEVSNMIINALPEKFDYVRHSFAQKVFEVLRQKGVKLY